MNACVAKCPLSPPGLEDPKAFEQEACSNERAKTTIHACFDACKFPKPSWDKD